MKKHYLLLICVIGVLKTAYSQWNLVNVGTTQDLYSVDYYSNNDIWVGSFNQFVKTSNGGLSWSVTNPLKDPFNANISPSNLNDIVFTGGNTAIATGFILMGNTESILQTTNSGTNWAFVSSNNSVPLSRYLNAFDKWGSNVAAVGNNGRIGLSNNNGASWNFVNSGTTKLINDVKYISIDTLIAAGNGIILKSVNSGTTWTSITTYTNSFKTLSCINNVIYIATEYDKTILKSTNFGVSYTMINLPFNSTGIIDAISKDTLLGTASDGLYISKSGGQYWEKYTLSNYQSINMIDHLSSNTLVAVGAQGYTIKTSNLTLAPSLPITSFSVQGGGATICLNDSVVLVNQTAAIAGYSYQWKHNGILYSNQMQTGIKLTTAGTHSLSLSVSNSFGTSTRTLQVTVTGHELNPLTTIISTDTICYGNSIGLAVPNSQTGVIYQFRKGFQNLGYSKVGDGTNLEFIDTYAYYPSAATPNYNIKATLSNSCYTDSLISTKVFVSLSYSLTLNESLNFSTSYCPNSTQDKGITNVMCNTLNNTTHTLFNRYFNYSCCKGTTVKVNSSYPISVSTGVIGGDSVSVWIDYNNNNTFDKPNELVYAGFANPTATGTIIIANTMLLNQKLRLRVISDQNAFTVLDGNTVGGCGQVEDYFIIIQPGNFLPTASFVKSAITQFGCTGGITFTNNSYNAQNITWNFGDGNTSTVTPVYHTFNALNGTYTVSLIACNGLGCDTSRQSVTVSSLLRPLAANCTPSASFCGTRPVINSLELPGVFNYLLYGTNDFTCSTDIHLLKDSLYYFYVGTVNTGALVMYADLNKDGNFSPETEAVTFGNGQYYIMSPGTSGPIPMTVPNIGVDSVPLRMRIVIDANPPANFGQNCCNIYCGDYKDLTLYTYPHKLQTFFSTPLTQTLCAIDSASVYFINSSKGATSYLWRFGDGSTSSLKEPTHTYTTSGIYTVKLITSNGITSDSLTKINLFTINLGVHSPSVTLLGTVLSTTTSANSYQWYRSSIAIATATTSSYSLTQSGDYQLSITNTYGCTMPSNTYSYYPLSVGFNITPTVVCTSDFCYFNNTSVNASNYFINWGDGTAIYNWNGSSWPIHSYSVAGTYTVHLKGCNATICDSATYMVTSINPPNAANIQLNGSILSTTTSAAQYQWYYNYSLIPSATSATYATVSNGDYQVYASNNAANCTVYSPVFSYYPTSINYSADTTSYCGNNSAQVLFNDASLNVANYYWDFGDGDTSNQINPSHTYTNTGIYTVKLKGCNNTNCDSLIKTNYITISAVPFITPTISPSGTLTTCYENAVPLSTTYNPSYIYQWRDGLLDITGATSYSINVNQDCSACIVVITNSLGCNVTSAPTIINYNTWCVWPGDIDNSGVVDNVDFLQLGLYFNDSGIGRSVITNTWIAQLATDWNWATTMSNGNNKKYVDCNGDGIVNLMDTLAIYNNYGLIHVFKTSNAQNFGEDLNIVPNQTTLYSGTWGSSVIYLGDTLTPMTNINGVAFNLLFDNTVLETDSIYMTYLPSFLNNNNSISFRKKDFNASVLHTALTHTNNINASGYGKIATLYYKIKPISSSSNLTISFQSPITSDNAGTINNITSNNAFINIQPSIVTDIKTINKSGIYVHPNPFTNTLHFNTTQFIENGIIKLYNNLGQLVIQQNITSIDSILNTINLSKGLYILELLSNKNSVWRTKILKD